MNTLIICCLLVLFIFGFCWIRQLIGDKAIAETERDYYEREMLALQVTLAEMTELPREKSVFIRHIPLKTDKRKPIKRKC